MYIYIYILIYRCVLPLSLLRVVKQLRARAFSTARKPMINGTLTNTCNLFLDAGSHTKSNGVRTYTHIHTNTHTHTYAHKHTHTLTRTETRRHAPARSGTPRHIQTRTNTHRNTHTHRHTIVRCFTPRARDGSMTLNLRKLSSQAPYRRV